MGFATRIKCYLEAAVNAAVFAAVTAYVFGVKGDRGVQAQAATKEEKAQWRHDRNFRATDGPSLVLIKLSWWHYAMAVMLRDMVCYCIQVENHGLFWLPCCFTAPQIMLV